eukprot:GHVN01054012.1.p1 GENE.GHVN01054012.1~~GHVN01054012.1.p1  ORF type:complete len:135 (-),score=45.31 GHVN01054012.1:908-1312(-)
MLDEHNHNQHNRPLSASIASPSDPPEKLGVYWGYLTRYTQSLSSLLNSDGFILKNRRDRKRSRRAEGSEGGEGVEDGGADKEGDGDELCERGDSGECGYDLIIGTSERGVLVDEDFALPRFKWVGEVREDLGGY